MAANVANVSFRIDRELKEQADNLFADLGMNMTTAFNVFLRQAVREGRIPFEITMGKPDAIVRPVETVNLSDEELDKELDKGYQEFLAGAGMPAAEVFKKLHKEYKI